MENQAGETEQEAGTSPLTSSNLASSSQLSSTRV